MRSCFAFQKTLFRLPSRITVFDVLILLVLEMIEKKGDATHMLLFIRYYYSYYSYVIINVRVAFCISFIKF